MTWMLLAALLWLLGSLYQVFTLFAAWRSWGADIEAADRSYREELAPAEEALRAPVTGATAEARTALHAQRFADYTAAADRLAGEFDVRAGRGRRHVANTLIAWLLILAASIAGVVAAWPVSA